MTYTPQVFKALPDTSTPLTAAKLTAMDQGIADAQGAAARAGGSAFSPDTAYVQGQLVTFQGGLYAATVAFTSGAAFDADDWTAMTSTSPVASVDGQVGTVVLSSTYARVDGTVQSIGDADQVQVRANIAAAGSAALGPYTVLANAQVDPITRAGGCAGIQTFLRNLQGAAGLQIITDSTGSPTSTEDGSPAWPDLTAQAIADAISTLTVRSREWQSTTQVMGPATTLQTGPGGLQYLDCSASQNFYLFLDHSACSPITGDLDIAVKISTTAGRDSRSMVLISYYGTTPASTSSLGWQLNLMSDNTLLVKWSPDGVSLLSHGSTASAVFDDDTPFWVRAKLDVDNGSSGWTLQFFTSTDDGATWTQLGTNVTGTGVTSIRDPGYQYQLGGTTLSTVTATISGAPTGGTWTPKFFQSTAGGTAAPVAFNAAGAGLQAGLTAVAAAGVTVAVTGTAGGPYTITLGGINGQGASLVMATNSLTGGTAPTVTITSPGGRTSLFEGRIYELALRSKLDGPTVLPHFMQGWSRPIGVNPWAGGPQLDVINAAWPSHGIEDWDNTTDIPAMTPDCGQLLTILASSHNDGALLNSALTAAWDKWLADVKARLPLSGFAVTTENPRLPPAGTILEHSQRVAQIRAWAAKNGVTSIDTYGAFLDDPRWNPDYTQNVLMNSVTSQGVHPSALAQQQIIMPLVLRAILTGA